MAGGGRGSGTGIDGLEESGDTGMGVAAEVSLAVAAKAAAENFPVALRILPRRYRAHLTALYGFARLVSDRSPRLSRQLVVPGSGAPCAELSRSRRATTPST